MFDDTEKLKKLSKFIIKTFTLCILIYLSIRHMNQIADTFLWMKDVLNPLIMGVILALFLNVPLGFIEKHLFRKHPTPRKLKLRRPLAILLSFVLVIGVLVGVAFLVVPELIDAITIVISSVMNGLDQLVTLESTLDYSQIPFGQQLSRIDIDFLELQNRLNEWLKQFGETIADSVANNLGNMASTTMDFVIGLVFSIYILANKERLKRQVSRFARVWLPERFAEIGIHVASICGKNFKLFVAGQTTEAIILGSLCTIGMLILRIPYAPMIGALVGVTALIPYVGAWIATLVGAFMIVTVNPFKALVFIIFLLTLQQIEGNAIYPKVVGAKINLPAMWVLAAITIGGNLAGPIGMLLGVPAASSLYSLMREATAIKEAKCK